MRRSKKTKLQIDNERINGILRYHRAAERLNKVVCGYDQWDPDAGKGRCSGCGRLITFVNEFIGYKDRICLLCDPNLRG